MFPVFSNLSDLSQKESIKERQNIEVKRTKTKSLVAQTSVTKKKKKKKKKIFFFLGRHSAVDGVVPPHPIGLGSNPAVRTAPHSAISFRVASPIVSKK